MRPDVPPCVHCRTFPASRPRRLCKRCYFDLDVRKQYPPRSQSSWGDTDNPTLLPARPTMALPGTPEKIRVLMERVEHGQELFHRDDHTWQGEGCVASGTHWMQAAAVEPGANEGEGDA